jgi:hypothetical protein
MTEKLFARTAKFFFVEAYYEKLICAEPQCIDSISQLLGVLYKAPQPSKEDIGDFIQMMTESSRKITSLLFDEKSEEFVQMVDNLSLDEVTTVLQTLSIIDLVANSKKSAKIFEGLTK